MGSNDLKQMASQRQHRTTKKLTQRRRSDLVKWCFGTVLLTLFPSLLTLVVGVLRGTTVSIELLIENGEMILSAFTIVTSTIISYYNKRKNSVVEETLFYTLLMICPLELVCYAVIKTNENTLPCITLVTSIACLLTSIVTSFIWYYLMNKTNRGEKKC